MSNSRKPLVAAIGYIAMGVLSTFAFLPGTIDTLTNGSSPKMTLGILGALALITFGIWSMLYGLSRVFMHASDRQKWFDKFQREEYRIRGGSRTMVIVLGCIAIALIGGSSLWFLRYY